MLRPSGRTPFRMMLASSASVSADSGREIRRDDARDDRLVEHDHALGVLAVAAAEAATEGGEAPALGDRSGVRRNRYRNLGHVVNMVQRALGENVRDGVRDYAQPGEAAKHDANPAQQTFHDAPASRISRKSRSKRHDALVHDSARRRVIRHRRILRRRFENFRGRHQ